MLIGEYEARLTDKNRLAIPKKFRTEFVGRLVISRGYEGCLIILDEQLWNVLNNKIDKSSVLNISVRDMKRFIFGGAYEIDVDDQGRFVLPSNLKEYAQIDADIRYIGIGDWVEIWDETKWKTKLKELELNASDIAEQIIRNNGKQT